MNQNIKILVITVPSWNSKVGANSWATLLENYPPENIASIYIRDEIPDSKVCSRYFNISENKIIKSIFHRNIRTGSLIVPQNAKDYGNHDLIVHNQRYEKMRKKRYYSMLLARELIWKVGKWRTPELDSFLDDFKPNVILHSMDGYIHLNELTEYIIQRTGAKAVGYIWDDNFTYKQSEKLGYKVYRYFQRRSLKRLARSTDAFFAISEMTKKEADAFFGIECKVLTKPLSSIPVVEYSAVQKPIRMLYTGNLYIGRDQSLLKVLKAIEAFPAGTFFVEVYTGSQLDDTYLSQINPDICAIHEPIAQNLAIAKQKEADILLFLEDTDGPYAHTARLSFSTKITDYLSSGRCILAVGNRQTAPMQYLDTNHAAFIAATQDEIEVCLRSIMQDPELVISYAKNAAEVGIRNHNDEKIQGIFDAVIESV